MAIKIILEVLVISAILFGYAHEEEVVQFEKIMKYVFAKKFAKLAHNLSEAKGGSHRANG